MKFYQLEGKPFDSGSKKYIIAFDGKRAYAIMEDFTIDELINISKYDIELYIKPGRNQWTEIVPT
jgi:hypothetical protein